MLSHRFLKQACLLLGLVAALGLGIIPGTPAKAEDIMDRIAKNAAGVIFTELEKTVIDEYYRKKRGVLGDDDDGRYRDGDDDDDDRGKYKHGKKDKKDKGNKGMPPGLAKRGGDLPPGLAKMQTLPPGLAKRDLPDDLEHRLPPPPRGIERKVVDGDVVLVDIATGVITDIIRDVLHGRE